MTSGKRRGSSARSMTVRHRTPIGVKRRSTGPRFASCRVTGVVNARRVRLSSQKSTKLWEIKTPSSSMQKQREVPIALTLVTRYSYTLACVGTRPMCASGALPDRDGRCKALPDRINDSEIGAGVIFRLEASRTRRQLPCEKYVQLCAAVARGRVSWAWGKTMVHFALRFTDR